MFLYNYLSGRKEAFKPLKGKQVSFYTCGPTVYDYAHIGNLRTFIFEDILRRSLKHEGYQVRQVMNLTDVEDKIIKRAKAEGVGIDVVTSRYSEAFFSDIKELNIEKAEVYPRATAHIKEMIDLIGQLMKKKLAYQGKDNSIYFNIAKFKNYGRLSGLNKRQIKAGARVEADEYSKNDATDFVLWKSNKPGEPFWKSPWGYGRPGWHIECSAMSMKYLGSTFDIHTGGVDLVFPHHENEIAQSEGATGKKFARFWLEAEHVLIDGKKMSKSLKNFFTLKDLREKGINPLSFRYLVLGTQYRKKLNFTWKSLKSAEKSLSNLRAILDKDVPADKSKSDKEYSSKAVIKYWRDFSDALADDLNTPKALSVLWAIVGDKKLSGSHRRELVKNFDTVLGFGLTRPKPSKKVVPEEINKLAAERESLRAHKQFIQADALRVKIESLGYKLEDTEKGPRVTHGKN
ncbi:MAG TPA: cysteine--tRNA ligase [Candidatus Paceibacterota bacterium]|nr:cysteine--tRNA ligase [Candidatus Paceibacterota bacterium]